jgi:hypothetical protein
MLNFLASCGLCSNGVGVGDYAYEAYPKLHPQSASQQPRSDSLVNNLPQSSVVAGDYTFWDLANDHPREVYIRKIRKSDYLALLRKHEDSGMNFIDGEFPPEEASIGKVEDLRVRATWKRIPDVIRDPLFIENRVDPSGIFQGSLGDNYFLSAISALAEKDYRIKNLFPELRMNRQGIYMARILY